MVSTTEDAQQRVLPCTGCDPSPLDHHPICYPVTGLCGITTPWVTTGQDRRGREKLSEELSEELSGSHNEGTLALRIQTA